MLKKRQHLKKIEKLPENLVDHYSLEDFKLIMDIFKRHIFI